ncbi:alpha/beta fold hydrolase [Microbacterium sp. Sa1CUA4]|uniref:Alpha/beta fold hydrolase n=1 Tax=Microbacterium gallinarum TaxID=2762209 RepID=A0ABR8WZZ3_9MICO|nr:alpha/beta fold hydrolase [Microbacterium gallinarum]
MSTTDTTTLTPDTSAGFIPNVVLVHGAFADGSGWRAVYDRLTARGHRVTIVQNPLTSLADDVAATRRVLDLQEGPTILVGHSWGGTVITAAGDHPNVVGLGLRLGPRARRGREHLAAVRGLRRDAGLRHRRRRGRLRLPRPRSLPGRVRT